MTISQSFETFLTNIKVDNSEHVSSRYKEITKKLNKTFRDTDSEIANCLQVGSYGRYTGIKGISDLDMLYVMPNTRWEDYKDDPGKLLENVRDALKERYPNTKIVVDRLVVDVKFSDFTFEVQPVFEEIEDDYVNYKYPDTKSGSYKITKPRQEQDEMIKFKNEHGKAHRLLCKMVRSVAIKELDLSHDFFNIIEPKERTRKIIDANVYSTMYINNNEKLTFEFDEVQSICGFRYTPNQSRDASRHIVDYELHVDGKLVKAGTFGNIKNNPIEQVIRFEEVKGKTVTFIPTRNTDDSRNGGIAEFSIITK